MSPVETLRAAVEASLRERDPCAVVDSRPPMHRYSPVCTAWAVVRGVPVYGHGATEADALAALAFACGLNADGTDPRAEVETLRRTLALAQESLAAAVRDERVTVVDEIGRLTRERDAAQWSAMAARQDIEHLARVVGRTSIELVLERVVDGRTVTQTPSAHVLADGRAYAPILGGSAPASPSLRDLIGAVEKAFGDGFKCTSTRPIGESR